MLGYIKKLISNNLNTDEILELIHLNELDKIKEVSDESLNKFIYEKPDMLHSLVHNNQLEMLKFFSSLYDVNLKNQNGFPPLFYASRNNNIEIVNFLIKKGANLNIQGSYSDNNSSGITPLNDAILANRWEIAKILIKAGADVNIPIKINNELTSPLLFVCSRDKIDIELVKLLIENDANINFCNKTNWTPLHYASRNDIEVVKLLIDKKADLNIAATYGNDEEGFSNITALYDAISNSRWEIAKLLINAGADVNISRQTEAKRSPLIEALNKNKLEIDIETIEMLIESGADINAQDKYGWSGLHLATLGQNSELVELLLKSGVKTNLINNNYKTASELALDNDYTNIFEIIREYTKDDNEIFKAIEENDIVKIKELLSFDSNLINSIDEKGNTPFYLALTNRNLDLVELFLKYEININNGNIRTFFLEKICKGEEDEFSLKVLEYLIEYGFYFNLAETSTENRPLHLALENGNINIAKKLIESTNVDLNEYNANDETPLLYGFKMNKGFNYSDLNYLIEAGADLISDESEEYKLKLIFEEVLSGNTYDKSLFYFLIDKRKIIEYLGWRNSVDLAFKYKNTDALGHIIYHFYDVEEELDFRSEANREFIEEICEEIFEFAIENDNPEFLKLYKKQKSCYSSFIYDDNNAITCDAFSIDLEEIISKKLFNILNYFIEENFDVNSKNNTGSTLLIQCVKNNSIEITKLLIESGADINVQNKNGWNALHFACRYDNREIVEYLIEKGVDLNITATYEYDKEGFSNITPLHDSISGKRWEIAKLLIKAGADVNISRQTGIKRSPLIEAFNDDDTDLETVEMLIESGANINAQDKDGWTVLHWAMIRNNIEVVNLLIKKKINLNITATYGNDEEGFTSVTALYQSFVSKRWEIARLLIKAGADVNISRQTGTKRSPLIQACANKEADTETIEMLIESGADINAQDKGGWSALHYASRNNNIEVVKLLVDKKADLNITATYGDDEEGFSNITPLYDAISNSRWEVAKLLIKAGADVTISRQTRSKRSPLIEACVNKKADIETIDLLLESGADISDQDKNGWGALYLAAQNNKKALKRILEIFVNEEINLDICEILTSFSFRNNTFELNNIDISDFGISLLYTNKSHEIVTKLDSFFESKIGIKNFRYFYKDHKLILEFMKANHFNSLLKDFSVNDTKFEVYSIKTINHSKYLFIEENKDITLDVCKQGQKEIEKLIGANVDIEEYDETHPLYDPDFATKKLIIIKENVINVLPKLLGLEGEYLKTTVEDGYSKYYFKNTNYDEWKDKLNEICELLNERLSIKTQNGLLVLTEKVEAVIPKLLELKDSNGNMPLLQKVKEGEGFTTFYYSFLPELDLQQWRDRSKKTNFRSLFNEMDKVYELGVYNKASKDYDPSFSTQQFITLTEYDAIPTKEELISNKLSRDTLTNNKVFMGYGKGRKKYGVDLNTLSHLAVVGSTGSGKSNLMNGIITSLLYNLNNIDKLYLMDLKGTEFVKYEDVKSDKITLFTKKAKPSMILEALLEIEAEMHLRTAYCQKQRKPKLTTNPIYFVIDEFKQIDNIYCETSKDHNDKEEIYKALSRIGSLSRSSNIKLIIQTQGSKDIPEDIRKHCMSRILMKTGVESDRDIHLQNPDKARELGINHLEFDKGRYILEDDNDGDTIVSELQFPYVDPYDDLHLEFQSEYDDTMSNNFQLSLNEFIPSVKEEYKLLKNVSRLNPNNSTNEVVEKENNNIETTSNTLVEETIEEEVEDLEEDFDFDSFIGNPKSSKEEKSEPEFFDKRNLQRLEEMADRFKD